MNTTKRKPINWGGKPKPAPAKTTLRAAPKPPKVRPREAIVTDMRGVLDDVNAALAGFDYIQWSWMNQPRLRQLNTIADELQTEYSKMQVAEFQAKRAAGDENAVYPLGRDEMTATVMSPIGAEPTYAYPARLVIWLEDAPLLMEWGGFLARHTLDIRSIDPRQPGLSKTGYRSAMLPSIHGKRSLRETLTELVSQSVGVKDGVVAVEGRYAEGMREWAEANAAWLAPLLAAPRVSKVAMPTSFSIQRSLI